MPGSQVHGASFIASALERGAVAILTDPEGAVIARDAISAAGVALVVTEHPRETLARTAALCFGAQPKTMVAVTGHQRQNVSVDFCAPDLDRVGVGGREPWHHGC